jgi:hypothetical protein
LESCRLVDPVTAEKSVQVDAVALAAGQRYGSSQWRS